MSDKNDLLKPCPHCGGKAALEDHRTVWVVRCKDPSCESCMLGERAPEPEKEEMGDGYWEKFEQSAIDRWNRRD